MLTQKLQLISKPKKKISRWNTLKGKFQMAESS